MNHLKSEHPDLEKALENLGPYLIKHNNFEVDWNHVIGDGCFGSVHPGTLSKPTKRAVAVKRLRKPRDDHTIIIAYRLAREMNTWKRLDHPNILKLFGFYLNPGRDIALIFSPLMMGGLATYLKDASVSERVLWAQDTLCGLDYLHNLDPPVVHGDLTINNTLLNDSRRAVLCDFGISRTVQEGHTGLTTNNVAASARQFLSPELLNTEDEDVQPTWASDMWAWGCLIARIIEDESPYTHHKGKISTADYPTPSSSLKRLPGLWPILEKCWQKDPTQRDDSRKCLESLTLKTTAVCLEPAELLFGRGGDTQQVVTTICNIQDRPLVFWFQSRASDNSSLYGFSPACGILPPRTCKAVKVTKLKAPQTDAPHPEEDKLRLRYSFMEKIEAGESPVSMWNKQVMVAPSAFWNHELTAGVGPRYRTGLANVRLKAACAPPQISLPSAPRVVS